MESCLCYVSHGVMEPHPVLGDHQCTIAPVTTTPCEHKGLLINTWAISFLMHVFKPLPLLQGSKVADTYLPMYVRGEQVHLRITDTTTARLRCPMKAFCLLYTFQSKLFQFQKSNSYCAAQQTRSWLSVCRLVCAASPT